MATTRNDSTAQDAEEIQRLVETAQEIGMPDHYHGKRHWTRFTAGMKLEVTTNPSEAPASAHVTMQNLSGGGFAFWSKRELLQHTSLFVREFSDDSEHEWVPAKVRHCTVGIRGFLIGAAFENAPPQTDPSAPARR